MRSKGQNRAPVLCMDRKLKLPLHALWDLPQAWLSLLFLLTSQTASSRHLLTWWKGPWHLKHDITCLWARQYLLTRRRSLSQVDSVQLVYNCALVIFKRFWKSGMFVHTTHAINFWKYWTGSQNIPKWTLKLADRQWALQYQTFRFSQNILQCH